MGNDLIKISLSNLHTGSSTTTTGAGTTDDLTNTLMQDFNTFLNLLSPLASEPIIGPGVTALMGALDEAGLGLEGTIQCFGTGLKILAPGMLNVAQSFTSEDNTLASTLKELEGLLPQVEQYKTSVHLTSPTPAQVTALNQYINAAKNHKTLQIKTTTVPIKVQQVSYGGIGGFIAGAGSFVGGVGQWFNDHPWAKWVAAGAAVVVGAGLIVLTLGAAAPEVVVADGAVITAAGATDVATTAAAGATDVATATVATTAADTTVATAASTAAAGDVVTLTTAPGGAETFTEIPNLPESDLNDIAKMLQKLDEPSLSPAGR